MYIPIQDEIQSMNKIELKQQDFIRKGTYDSVYCLKIHNIDLAVKCFRDEEKAKEENDLLQKILKFILGYSGMRYYFGLKNLNIEIIGEFSENYNGYAIFFEACFLNLQQKILNFSAEKRIKLGQICQELSNQKQLNMDKLQNCNFMTVIIQLINSFNQPKPIVNFQPQSFKSDILKNPLYSSLILQLFDKQNIQFSKIHSQYNIQPHEFESDVFHYDCDNKGSTLIIMHSSEEPNSFFGAMAVPQWNSVEEYITDPADECSWLFKLEVGQNMIDIHQWKCIKKEKAVFDHPFFGPCFGDKEGKL